MWILGSLTIAMAVPLVWAGWQLCVTRPSESARRRQISRLGFAGISCSFAGLIGLALMDVFGLRPFQDASVLYVRVFGLIGLAALPFSAFARGAVRLVLLLDGAILFVAWTLCLVY